MFPPSCFDVVLVSRCWRGPGTAGKSSPLCGCVCTFWASTDKREGYKSPERNKRRNKWWKPKWSWTCFCMAAVCERAHRKREIGGDARTLELIEWQRKRGGEYTVSFSSAPERSLLLLLFFFKLTFSYFITLFCLRGWVCNKMSRPRVGAEVVAANGVLLLLWLFLATGKNVRYYYAPLFLVFRKI